MSEEEARTALERFVVENNDLLELESRIGKFNIFDALRITHAEIRHSNFLAFLLDPAESHGQGQLFLKAILMDLLQQAPPERRPLSPIELDGTDLRGVEVRREWECIDMRISCEEPRFVVIIENKIRAKEGPDQLRCYEETTEKQYTDFRRLYVYLTLNGDEPSRDTWMPYSYEDIYRVLKRVREACHNAIGDDVLVFLDHYLSLLGTRFMNDDEINELCQRIRKNHRQALDLIWELAGTPTSGVIAELEAVLQDDDRWKRVARPRNCIDVVPNTWLEWLPPLALRGDLRSWICVHFFVQRRVRLNYAVEVAPLTDPAKREVIVRTLRGKIPEYGLPPHAQPAGEVSSNRVRITGGKLILGWREDEEPDSAKIRAAVRKTLDDLYPKLERLGDELRSMCNCPPPGR